MKKIVIGIFIGAFLMFSGQVLADSISKIGKKVQAEYVVKVDGVALESKGLAIDGQTTVPARALGDALGYDVAFKNKEVLLTKKEDKKVVEPTKEPVVTPEPSQEPQYTLESIESLIVSQESKIRKFEDMLAIQISDGSDSTQLKEDLSKMKEELANLKAIKAELEAQQK